MSRPSPPRHHLAAVMFADIVGYSALASRDEARSFQMIHAFQRVAREAITHCQGRLVKFSGDGVLAEFLSTEYAVRAAHRLLQDFSRTSADPLPLRIGIHVGDVMEGPGGDVYGDGVNSAARLQGLAEPGQILVGEDVWRHLHQRRDFVFKSLGQPELKGIGAIPVYEVQVASESPEIPAPAHLLARIPRRIVMAGIATVSIAAVALLAATGDENGNAGSSRSGAPLAPAIDPRSIAVLPFQNLTSDPANEYLTDGITDEIITALAGVPDLRVTSRTSSVRYKDSDGSLLEIGQELGVAAILEGGVRREGDRVRVTAQLIDTRTDAHLWTGQYDRGLADVFAIQSEIAHEIAAALQSRLSQDARARLAATARTTPEAYDPYLRAKDLYWRGAGGDSDAIIALFRQALRADPTFAAAQAWLGMAYVKKAVHSGESRYLDEAREAGHRAIDLDPLLADGYQAVGFAHLYRNEFEEARHYFREAIERNRSNGFVLAGLAAAEYWSGRFDEALRWGLKAVTVDPLTPQHHMQVAEAWLQLGEPVRAGRAIDQVMRLRPEYPYAYITRARLTLIRGQVDSTRALLDQAVSLGGTSATILPLAGDLALAAGDLALAERYYRQAIASLPANEKKPFVPLAHIAKIRSEVQESARYEELAHAQLDARARHEKGWILHHDHALLEVLRGDREAAQRALEQAYQEGWRGQYWGPDTMLRQLDELPRYRVLLGRIEADKRAMRLRAAEFAI